MASDTSSRARKRLRPLASLSAALDASLRERPVPLLVLRLPEFERIAWREGKRAARRLERATALAFEQSAARMLRRGDCTGHDAGSDLFVAAMTAPSREVRYPGAADIRAVLERLSAALSLQGDLRVESGWTMLSSGNAGLERGIALALERGARERERFEFFSAIGHELRTPLTSIRGYLETLLEEETDPGTTRRFLEVARREAMRMGRLLEGMFEFSLLDLSGQALAARWCELAPLLQQACEVVRPLARGRGIRVELGATPRVRAALDADACLQLLVNLLENAVKYARDGGLARIEARVCRGEALVAVDDDGRGVDAREREEIFGLRVRGAGAGRHPGTGIGLAIVKLIAERAGGSVRVTGSPLGGARFEAVLPLKQESGARAS